MSSDSMSLHEAAERLGVHYMTVYRYVRLGLLPATKVGGSWSVLEVDLAAFTAPAQQPSSRGQAPWSERLESRMLAGDLAGSWSVVEAAMASGCTPPRVYTDLVVPALVSIGQKWADAEIGIDEEHQASAIATRIVGRMGSLFARRGRTKGSVVLAMPSGDRHGLALAMLADVLRGEGYAVVDLGADIPARSIVDAAHKVPDLHAVCISVVYREALESAAETIGLLKSEIGSDLFVVIGGGAVASDEHARELGADKRAASLTDVPELVQEWAASA
ncbi:MAG: cobalamin-dependent protein [Acidimicrobiia bacterium]|nr:cobalamin-dependent protein [Acidimicrobiia bacterium]MDH4306164.1 cobalamin-dependent protein [Acidimicrobiia bacterium]MDH5292090.1 cobalamin-dependent protein [Acidimicrobiia bacterium]